MSKIKIVPLPEIETTIVFRAKNQLAIMVQALEDIPAGEKLALELIGFPGTPKNISKGEIFWLLVNSEEL